MRNAEAIATKATVLIVDDDPDTRWMTTEALRTRFDVAAAATPAEALASARAHAPDAMVVDLTLGTESGWHLIGLVQSDPGLQEVPVVVLSADCRAQPPEGLRPCAAYLTKPCRMTHLREVLERVLPRN